MSNSKERIVWIDYIKAILIILVVVGHATGRFNGYIYQFHVAAFFIVSGLLAKEENNVAENIYSNFMRLMIPLLITFFSCVGIMWLFNRLDILNIFTNNTYMGARFVIKEFLLNGNQYIFVLGATWFLISLFFAEVIHDIITRLTKNVLVYVICMITAYVSSFVLHDYLMVTYGKIPYGIDIAFVAFFYYGIGYLLSKILIKKSFQLQSGINILLIIYAAAVMYLIKNYKPYVMDIVSRVYTDKFWCILVALNGFVLVWAISYLISGKNEILDKIMIFISKNTMGVLLFHFMAFKFCYIILALLKRIPKSDICNLVPTNEMGIAYWWLIAPASLGISIGFWYAVNKIKVFNIVLGQNKEYNEALYTKIAESKLVNNTKNRLLIGIQYIKEKITTERAWFILLCLLAVIIGIPIVRKGIMCNDELQSRFWGMQGFRALFEHYKLVSMAQGRLLAIIPVSIYFMIEFAFSNKYWSGIIAVLVLLGNAILIYMLVEKVMKRKECAQISAFLFLVCLPVVFEHTLPNAFVAFLGIPLALFMISILLTLGYYQNRKNGKLIIAMIMLFFALCSYEGIVTLMPFYAVIAVLDAITKGKFSIKQFVKNIIIPFAVSVFYLILYILCGKIVPTMYSGNEMVFSSLGHMGNIIANLIKGAIPGYYTYLSPKYSYFREVWGGGRTSIYEGMFSGRVLAFIVIAIIIWYFISKNKNMQQYRIRNIIISVGILLSMMIIVSLPISLSAMYQNSVGESGFIGLPTSYIIYILMVILIAIILEVVIDRFKAIIPIMVTLVILFIIPIQNDNDIYSSVMSKTYERLENIECLLNNDIWENVDATMIYGGDLYLTQNALGIHDNYWTDYMRTILGKDVNIVNDKNECSALLTMISNDSINIMNQDKGWIISINCIANPYVYLNDGSVYYIDNYRQDESNNLYIYEYNNDDILTDYYVKYINSVSEE